MKPEGDPPGGGGGDPKPDPAKPDPKGDDPAALKQQIADLQKKLSEREPADPDLHDKMKKDQDERNKRSSQDKSLESAITFNLQSKSFLKDHAALLPKDIEDLFTTADKESYDSPVEKASEVKSGMIQAFFNFQENLDLLTSGQKAALADYLKLTKNGRKEKAQDMYSTIFEPALEMLKRVKKAEQVNRSRNGFGDDTDSAYKAKLSALSKKHYLGEKPNGT